MATDMEALTQEIRKIVLAPYAVCLKVSGCRQNTTSIM